MAAAVRDLEQEAMSYNVSDVQGCGGSMVAFPNPREVVSLSLMRAIDIPGTCHLSKSS